jgi:uncharacterized protein with GYD domain
MPTYVVFTKYTPQGMKSIKDSPARLDAAKQTIKKAGGELKAYYLLMGQYDEMAIIEAPDDTTLAKLLVALGAQGNVSTQTLKAFTEEEYRAIIAALP